LILEIVINDTSNAIGCISFIAHSYVTFVFIAHSYVAFICDTTLMNELCGEEAHSYVK